MPKTPNSKATPTGKKLAPPSPAAVTPGPLKPAAKAAKALQAKPPAPAAKDAAKDKAKKPKLVRDSFTIPKTEYAVIDALKLRAAKAGAPAKKSEVLRAGIKLLASLSDEAFLAAMGAVPSLKTGRPAKQ